MDIDLVYLWVDGSDPEWLARRCAFTGQKFDNTEANCKGRYADNDELKYNLRAVEMYAPWIRHVFIVTDGQTPAWLDTSNPKVTVVNQNDIIPEVSRPCYNSSLIEHFLYRIPGLSEYFLYANDDMFLNRPVPVSGTGTWLSERMSWECRTSIISGPCGIQRNWWRRDTVSITAESRIIT